MVKQNILNYEVQMIDYHSQGLSKPDNSINHQYTTWQLDQKILSLMGSFPCTVRWIGNHQSAYLDSFVYIMLSMSLKKQSMILKLKERIYELSRKYLSKSSQKLIVQFLCLMQYTQDKYSFLRKYPQVVKMIVCILKSFEKQVTHKDIIKMSSFILESPIKEKRKQSFSVFCSKFNFINVSQPNDFTYKFSCDKQIIYVVIQKDCFFIMERNPVLHDQNQSEQRGSKYLNSTPRFCVSSNTLQKPKSQNKRTQNHLIHKNKKSQNLIDYNSSADCSIEQIHNSLQNGEQSESKPYRKLQYEKFKTQTYLPSSSPKQVRTKSKKKDLENQNVFFIRQLELQQKRRQHWLKLEREYYEKKKQICKKIKQEKNLKNQVHGLFNSKHQEYQTTQKQRKMSFNSFTGHSYKDKYQSDFGEQYDRKSNVKSHEDFTKSKLNKQRKLSFKISPDNRKKRLLKKKNNNRRLSVIQEENRLKFWNFNNKTNTQNKTPKITSVNSSNRQTLDANVLVTFNYVNKNSLSPGNISPPSFHKIKYFGSPIRV